MSLAAAAMDPVVESESESSQDLVESVIEALIQHYQDPIHDEDPDDNDGDEGDDNDDDEADCPPDGRERRASVVVDFQLRRLLNFGGTSDDSTADGTSSTASRVRDVWVHLVQSYATRIRPTLFAGVGRAPKLAVVAHYQRLTGLYLKHNEGSLLGSSIVLSLLGVDDPQEGAIPRHEPEFRRVHERALERLACDVTLATALEVRRKGPPRDDGDDDDEVDSTATYRIVVALIRHMTTVGRIAMARRGRASSQCTALATTTAMVRSYDELTPLDRIALRCAISLLPFQWNPTTMLGIAPRRTNADVTSSSADPLHCLPMSLAPKEPDPFHNLTIWNSMDWGMLLDLKGSVWSPPRKDGKAGPAAELQTAVRELMRQWRYFEESRSSDPPAGEESAATDEVLTLRRWSSDAVSRAVRAHFFGRDMLVEPDEVVVVPKYRTRLHLGTTVRYEPDPDVTEKPHLRVPSRVVVALHWMTVLPAEQLTESVWEELLPILYELLSASSYALNGWGAVAVYRLVSLHNRQRDSFLVSEKCETSIQNLLLMLHTVAKTCREGPVLAVVGKANCKLLGILGARHPASVAQQRRSAAHHWLTVLYQNETRASTQPSLILGLITGAIQILYDQVTCEGANAASGLEVGRLGLSALLPLLDSDEEDGYAALEPPRNSSTVLLRSAIRVAALVALNNLMIAAYPIVPRHAGKILSRLLRVCAEIQQPTKAANETGADSEVPQSTSKRDLLQLATHVASTAVVLSRDKGGEFLTSLENDRASYCSDFMDVLDNVRARANALKPPMTSVEQRTSAPSGLIQVL